MVSFLWACSAESTSAPGARDAEPGPNAGPDAGAGPDASAPDVSADVGPVEAGLGNDASGFPDAGPEQTYVIVVTLDGSPAPGVTVVQGGVFDRRWVTDADGRVEVRPDDGVVGDDIFIMASHPEARIMGIDPRDAPRPLTIALTRFDASDNPAYRFTDPGEPGRRETTAQCGHCHRTANDQWASSIHAASATNPFLHDLYAGAAHTLQTRSDCEAAGGRWAQGLEPGTRQPQFRCYLGSGYLPSRNPDCRDASCDESATVLGSCADCHAPGIDGDLGGRGLLEAEGFAYRYGVHCDVCHRVESVDLEAPAGVAGRLRLLRPSEPALISLGGGGWLPLTFGPSPDSPNPRMGSVARSHFRESRFCAGCHELVQDDFPPGTGPDLQRWPDGELPVQSTFSEWQGGVLSSSVNCQGCHMPPDPTVGNHSDVHLALPSAVGFVGGWFRPPGSMRKHTWPGPRDAGSNMLAHAAAIRVTKTVAGDRLTAEVRVKNVGAGHAIPTGEPLRHMLLSVGARCGGEDLVVLDAPVVPDYGGYRARRSSAEDWSQWPEAAAGDRVRVVAQPGGYIEYSGVGPFGDGRFSTAAKGLRQQAYVQEATIVAVDGDGRATFDTPLALGDIAYLVRGPDDWAGRPGFGFARLMADSEGRTMVPHFEAVDVVSDNRLLPQASFTTRYVFATTCADPVVEATLVYRRFPVRLARARRWPLQTQPMTRGAR